MSNLLFILPMNAELVEEKEKKLCSKNLIIHSVEESSSDNKDDAIKSNDIYINNFIAPLKVTSTVKSASRIGLPTQDKNRPIKVVLNTEEEKNRFFIKSKKPERYSRIQNHQRY